VVKTFLQFREKLKRFLYGKGRGKKLIYYRSCVCVSGEGKKKEKRINGRAKSIRDKVARYSALAGRFPPAAAI